MTIRAKISILIAVIISITLGLTGYFHLRFFEDSLRNSVFHGLETISGATSQLVSRFVTDTLKEVETVALSFPKDGLERKDILIIEDTLRVYSEKLPKFENGIFLLDEKGVLWADYPAHPEVRGQSFAFREYYRKTVEEKRGIVAVYQSTRSGIPVLTFTAPLWSSSGRMIGLLGCSVQLTSSNVLEGIRLTRIGKTGCIYVFNRDRLMILHPQKDRILKKDVPVGVNKLFDAAIDGYEGLGETVNSRGISMLISMRQIPGTDWLLGAQQSKDEAFSPVREAQNRILASIIFAVIVAAVIAAFTVRGITRPLLKLRKAVTLLGYAGEAKDGALEKEYRKELADIHTGGDIGDLTRAFLGISKQLEKTMGTLKNSARDWERTFDSVSDAILIVDGEGRIIRLNHAARIILETGHKEILGKRVLDFLGRATITDNYPGNEETSVGEQAFLLKLEHGLAFTFEVAMTPLLQGTDRVGTVITAKDITSKLQADAEKRLLEAQLQQAQKMEAIGTLAGGIAHNFNNLLMGIQGNASLILLDTDSDQVHYRRAKNIEKLVQSGSRLTGQLLGYAREGRFQVKPISLNHLAKETSDTFAMARKDIRVEQDFAKDLVPVLADQGQIEQILMNLYVNAADAMPNGGTLSLKTENVNHGNFSHRAYEVKPGKYALLSVRDTGTGMDKKTLERIFEPFFTTKSVGKGTGLGLASVYGIVKAHDGYVDVESEWGRGSTFHIYLPAGGKRVVRERETTSRLTRGHEKVLLVDDEEMILDVGEKILKAIGYDVSLARSGHEAIEVYKYQNNHVDLVLLDMIMPDMCGGEAYDSLKKINPDVKVLLSSGYSIDGQATEILKRGCNGFIQKPFNIEQLSQKIREIMGTSQQDLSLDTP